MSKRHPNSLRSRIAIGLASVVLAFCAGSEIVLAENPVAPEAAVIRTHLDWIVALPWSARSRDSIDVRRAASVLEAAHFGLQEVKERILDHVAVLSLVHEMRGPILTML